jgi:ATP-dependent 26S proteasome regulatory subunit
MSYLRTGPIEADAHKHCYECKRCIVLYEEIDRNGERRPDRARKLDRELVRTLQ